MKPNRVPRLRAEVPIEDARPWMTTRIIPADPPPLQVDPVGSFMRAVTVASVTGFAIGVLATVGVLYELLRAVVVGYAWALSYLF